MNDERRELTVEEFRAEIKAQGVDKLDYAFICPACNTVQSARWLIAVGAGEDFDSVQGQLGFSCVGRHTGAGGDKREEGKGCNWTCGGLFQIHKLTVITPDGKKHPHFEVATPEQAIALRDAMKDK
ncbi:VVA0879 family protein [Citrobacter freundii]|uniref:VVA0879 family protein n=1 Tax=Citrobacter freundii TaxID=546 RepID=UPI002B2543CC|nr:VVA0879 family protein [Citrobacter freundii]MEB2478227.1 VVA0879 family protein [Citrobacter freundii]